MANRKIKGTASVVFFYMGDSYLRTLAQETVPLSKAMEGYDTSILLKHDVNLSKFNMSKRAEKNAEQVLAPTKENLVAVLKDLDARGYAIDLFIFSHGFREGFVCSRGTHEERGVVRGRWLEKQFDAPISLRMVYSIACWGASLNDNWLRLGAKASVGATSVNFYPTRFNAFIKRWNRGEAFSGAVRRSDAKITRIPVHAFIQADAIGTMGKWKEGIRGFPYVLGKGRCSEPYFRKMWQGDDWVDGHSGKRNMTLSSLQKVVGNTRLKKSTRPVWAE